MIVLQSAVNEATFEVLYSALTATKTQLSQSGVSCGRYLCISGDVTDNAEVTWYLQCDNQVLKNYTLSGAKNVVLICGTVRKLQQCRYAGVFYPLPPLACVCRPNTFAGLRENRSQLAPGSACTAEGTIVKIDYVFIRYFWQLIIVFLPELALGSYAVQHLQLIFSQLWEAAAHQAKSSMMVRVLSNGEERRTEQFFVFTSVWTTSRTNHIQIQIAGVRPQSVHHYTSYTEASAASQK